MQAERNVVDDVLAFLNDEAIPRGFFLQAFRWEQDARPTKERPLVPALRALERCELVIVLFGDTIGTPSSAHHQLTGTLEELAAAGALHEDGRLDDIFLYFRRSAADTPASRLKAALREAFTQTWWDFDDAAHLRELVERHTRNWMIKWDRVVDACKFALARQPIAYERAQPLGHERLEPMLELFDPRDDRALANELGAVAVAG